MSIALMSGVRSQRDIWLVASMLSTLLCLHSPLARAQPKECSPQALIGTQPGQGGTVIICSTPLRADPAFKALALQLSELSQRNEELSAAVRKLAPSLNGSTQGMSNAQLSALAASISRRLTMSGAQADSRTAREIDRLRLSLEDIKDRLDAAESDAGRHAQVRAAMVGPAGDALARLDFAIAQKLLDDIGQIKEQTLSACAKDPKLLAIAKAEAAQAMSGMQALQAPSRCAKGWTTALAFHEAAVAAEAKGDLNAACSSYQEFAARSTAVRSELSSADYLAQARAQAAQQQRGQLRMMYETQHSHVVRDNRVMATRMANTERLRAELAKAHETLAQAEAHAAELRWASALDKLHDAGNMYRSIEYEGGRYNQPFVPRPKQMLSHLIDLERQAIAQAREANEAIGKSGFSVCQ